MLLSLCDYQALILVLFISLLHYTPITFVAGSEPLYNDSLA